MSGNSKRIGVTIGVSVAMLALSLLCSSVRAGAAVPTTGRTPVQVAADEARKLTSSLVLQLRSGSPQAIQKAVEQIRQLAPRAMAENLPQLLDPLKDAKQYDALESLALAAIVEKANDITTVQAVQKARVQALLDQAKYPDALVQAKSYYNIVPLGAMDEAVSLVVESLEKSGSAPVAARFKFEQLAGAQADAPTTAPVGAEVAPQEWENVLAGIKVDASPYEPVIRDLEGRGSTSPSNGNLTARGNLLLLADRPDKARECFQAACLLQGNGKAIRESVEGVARAIKAQGGIVGPANAFILAMRQDPATALPSSTRSANIQALRTAAQQAVLATTKMTFAPPLEEERVLAEARAGTSAVPAMKIVSDFEAATPLVVRRISPTHFELTRVVWDSQNWFMFSIEGVAGKTIRFDVVDPSNPLKEWVSMNPVCADIADLSALDSFSASVAKEKVTSVRTWNGQGTLLPSTAGQKWNYVPDVWKVDANTIAFVKTFDSDKSYVAMRIPCTPTFNERHLRQIVSSPAAKLIEVGRTKQGRPLLMVEIGSAADAQPRKPCVLFYAGEHADEPDSMWAAHGVIEYLLGDGPEAKRLRDQITFLVIPLLDPDATASARHEGMYMSFVTGDQTPESVAYANWFQRWINQGNRLDLVFDIHNVQSLELGHVACALMEGLGERGQLSASLDSLLSADFGSDGLSARVGSRNRGWSPDRLGGWLSRRYGPLCFAYEVNSQAPNRHLNLYELKDMGRIFVVATGRFLSSTDGSKVLANVDVRRNERLARWSKQTSVAADADAITAEAIVSKGVGVSADNTVSEAVEKWVP